MTHDEMIAVITAHKERKQIQFKDKSTSNWETFTTYQPSWNFYTYDYRIAPDDTLRPWTANEVPLGAWVQEKSLPESKRLITGVSAIRVYVNGCAVSFDYLHSTYNYSIDNGRTWHPCGVTL